MKKVKQTQSGSLEACKNQEGVWEASLASGVCEAHPAGQVLGQGLQSPLGEPAVSLGHERHRPAVCPGSWGSEAA